MNKLNIKLFFLVLIFNIGTIGAQNFWMSPFNNGISLDDQVTSIESFQGNLYFGGYFSNPQKSIYSENVPSIETNGVVYSLLTFSNNLIAGGEYSFAGSSAVNNIAAWNGSAWSSLSTGIDGKINALETDGTYLYAAGDFVTAGGLTVSNIAKWDGSVWTSLGTGTDSTIYSLKMFNGNLYAGGAFTNAGGVVCNKIAKWDGTNWSSLTSGINGDCVYALENNLADNRLYVGGNFQTAGGQPAHHFIAWSGTAWQSLQGNFPFIDTTVYSLKYENSSELIHVGGDFQNHLLMYHWSGGISYYYSVNDRVNAIFIMPGAKYIGGIFTYDDFFNNLNFAAKLDLINNIEKHAMNEPYIFPNPAQNEITFKFEKNFADNVTIKMIDILGNLVKEDRIQLNGSNKANMDVSNLPNGIYYYTIEQKNGSILNGKTSVLK